MNTLFINACLRPDSRTKILADAVLAHIKSKESTEITEVNLSENPVAPLSTLTLTERNELLLAKKIDDSLFDYSKQFATADEIIIAAPFWDLSFPAALKAYLESVNVSGVTFKYSKDGQIIGLCRAKRLIYVTTAGGKIPPENCGFGYVKSLCEHLYGINNVVFIKAEGLDIFGADINGILQKTKEKIPLLLG